MSVTRGNFIEAVNGRELTAGEIERSGCSVIVVVPAPDGAAVELAVIRLPRAAKAKGELTIVQRTDAFAYIVLADAAESINGEPNFVRRGGGGVRLVPLVSTDGMCDGWGTI